VPRDRSGTENENGAADGPALNSQALSGPSTVKRLITADDDWEEKLALCLARRNVRKIGHGRSLNAI
jgi:hypothetical protein